MSTPFDQRIAAAFTEPFSWCARARARATCAVAVPGCRLHTRAFERAVLGLVLAFNHLHKVVGPLPSKHPSWSRGLTLLNGLVEYETYLRPGPEAAKQAERGQLQMERARCALHSAFSTRRCRLERCRVSECEKR